MTTQSQIDSLNIGETQSFPINVFTITNEVANIEDKEKKFKIRSVDGVTFVTRIK